MGCETKRNNIFTSPRSVQATPCVGFVISVVLLASIPRLCATSHICTKRICSYDFVIERKQTMTYNHENRVTFNVGLNKTNLQLVESRLNLKDNEPLIGQFVDPNDVITADGYPRDVITINGQFPGPTLEVLEGAEVWYEKCGSAT